MNIKTIFSIIVSVVIVGCLCVEIVLRFTGAIDFPVYQVDDDGHYSLKENQQGKFLNKNEWFVNSRGLNNSSEFDKTKPHIFLVGDSVVYGGNPVNYYDRVGYNLEVLLNKNIYVGALGGWSLYNEIKFIEKNLDIARSADALVIQYDNGDLYGLSTANIDGSVTHPTSKPLSATMCYLEKYVYPKIVKVKNSSELPLIPGHVKTSKTWDKDLLTFSDKVGRKILFVLYPDKESFLDKELWAKQTYLIKKIIDDNPEKFAYIDIAKSKNWSDQLYRDGVHPNVQGDKILAEEIAKFINEQK